MNVTLLDLAQALTAVDVERTCPFCTKQTWGADQHETDCPFHLAYLAINGVREANIPGVCEAITETDAHTRLR